MNANKYDRDGGRECPDNWFNAFLSFWFHLGAPWDAIVFLSSWGVGAVD